VLFRATFCVRRDGRTSLKDLVFDDAFFFSETNAFHFRFRESIREAFGEKL